MVCRKDEGGQCVTAVVWLQCWLPVSSPGGESQCSLLMELPGGQSLTTELGSDFRQVGRVQRKPPTAFAVFLVPSAQSSQYAKMAHIGVACPELLQERKGECKNHA